MNRIYSNIKQIALSLLVVGLAISTQSFINSSKKIVDPNWVYVQDAASGLYEKITFSSYNPSLCESETTNPCSFTQPASDGADHGNSLTYTAINSISGLERSANGVYNP